MDNLEFLKTIFGEDHERAFVCGFPGDPSISEEAQWGGGVYTRKKHVLTPENNTYYAVSIFNEDETGRVFRREDLLDYIGVAVCDDIGTGPAAKIHPKKWNGALKQLWGFVPIPTYIIETSPGNFHFGYQLTDADREKSLEFKLRWNAFTASQTSDGSDPGNAGVTRYVRLPVGTNTKNGQNFKHVLKVWNPEYAGDIQQWIDVLPEATGSKTVSGGQTGALASTGATHLDAADDPTGWGAVLESRGLIGAPHKDGGWHITCPFVEEHTGGKDNGTAYIGDGCFKCWHGHCIDRTPQDFRDKLIADDPTIAQELAKKQFEDVELPDDWEDVIDTEDPRFEGAFDIINEINDAFVYMPFEPAMFCRRTLKSYPIKSFNIDYEGKRMEIAELCGTRPAKGAPPAPLNSLVRSKKIFRVDGKEHAPGEEEFFKVKKANYVNTWRDAGVGVGVTLTSADQPVLDCWDTLLKQLIGDDDLIEKFEDWIALLVGNQGTKPAWHWVIISGQGWGKNFTASMIGRMLGSENMAELNITDLRNSYTEWAKSQLVVVDELSSMDTSGRKNGASMYDDLKRYLVQGDKLHINEKYGRQYYARNVGGYLMFSNKSVPILLEDDDRRLCIVDRRGETPIVDWEDTLDTLLTDRAADVLAHRYRQRWVLMKQANKDAILRDRPPKTEAKDSIIEASIAPIDEFVKGLMENHSGHGPLWTSDDLTDHLAYEKKREPRYRGLGYQMVLKHLKDAGAWNPGNHPKGQVRGSGPGGKRSVVLAVYEDPAKGLTKITPLPDDSIRGLMAEYAAEDDDNVVAFPSAADDDSLPDVLKVDEDEG